MKLTLQPRRFYGKIIYFPLDPVSRVLAELHRDRRANNRVLTKREVDLLKSVGFEIELIPYLESDDE